MPRLMAKVFDVPKAEKGSPLQSKFNAFTKDKDIVDVHSIDVSVGSDGNTRAVLLYADGEADKPSGPRVLAKVIEGAALGSELQTKVNSFSKGKEIPIKAADVAVAPDGTATAVVVYTKDAADTSTDE